MDYTHGLPVEMWETIALYLDRDDLQDLALVSPFLCTIARLVLAHTVTIKHTTQHPQGIDSVLLLTQQNLLYRIREMSLIWYGETSDLVDINVIPFRHMVNLRRLKISAHPGCPLFCTPHSEWLLSSELSVSKLVNLEVICDNRHEYQYNIPIRGLQSLSWEYKSISSTFMTLCVASLATITNLSLEYKTDCAYTAEFFALRFKTLQYLKIGPGDYDSFIHASRVDGMFDSDEDTTNQEAFGGFLHAHPSIHTLDLVFESHDGLPPTHMYFATYLEFISRSGVTNILPNLDVLILHPDSLIENFLLPGVHALKTLSKLSIKSVDLDDRFGLSFPNMCQQLEDFVDNHGPLQLRTIVLHILLDDYQYLRREEAARCVQQIAKACPHLEQYIGDFFDERIMKQEFIKFKNLRTMSLPAKDLHDETVMTLASAILTLETIRCFYSGRTIYIARDSAGTITLSEAMVQISECDIIDNDWEEISETSSSEGPDTADISNVNYFDETDSGNSGQGNIQALNELSDDEEENEWDVLYGPIFQRSQESDDDDYEGDTEDSE